METKVSKIDMTNVIRYKYVLSLAERFFDLKDKNLNHYHNSKYTQIEIYKDSTVIAKITLESDGTLTTLS